MNIRKKRINDLVIVVIENKIYNRTGVDDATWIKILEACEEVEQSQDFDEQDVAYANLLDLLVPERIAQREAEIKAKQAFMDSLQLELNFDDRMRKAKRIADISGLFEYDEDGITYLKGFKHPMPKILVEALLDAHYNPSSKYTVDSLVNFWKYLLLNPDKHVRTGLFEWIKTGKFALTEDGNIISYRNVDVKKSSTDKKLQDFISETYTKIKKWKKSPKNYIAIQDNKTKEYFYALLEDKDSIVGGTVLGTISDMLSDLDTTEDVTVYTDNYTRTMEIKLGEPVSMERAKCDNDPNSSCSRGLHQKSAAYGLNLGSEVIVCLVNPYHVVAIPSHDVTKFRTCQYLPVSKAEVVGHKLIEFDPGTYDIPYNGLESLVGLLKTTSLEELQAKGEISADISSGDFDFVLAKAKEVIANRVVKFE